MFTRIKELTDKGETFLITTHIDPDGDAVGSAMATYFALVAAGKKAHVYLKDNVPYRYSFLPQPPEIEHKVPEAKFDGIFVVDCGNFFRVGEGYEKLKGKGTLVNIDHHDTNEAFGELNVIDERASSTAEILYLIFKSLNVPFDYNIAANIYTAVLTDTGSFNYENTNSRAFLICEEMTRFGVSPAYVAGQVYESHPKERYHLLCLVLSTLQTYSNDRVAVAGVTKEMFEKTGTNREYTDGFVEMIREIKGTEVACFLREIGPGRYKVSMRSRGRVNVASVASTFGGGGHKNAAGCVIEGSLEEAKSKLVGAFTL